jgi:hypothetical protein
VLATTSNRPELRPDVVIQASRYSDRERRYL